MSDSIKLGSVALECPDARQLAAFYAEITGGAVTSADEDCVPISYDAKIMFDPTPSIYSRM